MAGGLLDDDGLLDVEGRRRQAASGSRATTPPPGDNRELDAWQRANDAQTASSKDAKETETAIPPGTCVVCKNRPGRQKCMQCGADACAADYWVMLGLCRACATEERVHRMHKGAGSAEGQNWLETDR